MKRIIKKDPVLLKNINCPYCGIILTSEITTKEHVIGRRFVPRGKFDKSWNLIVNCCADCNTNKSNLEDDISAITMQPNAWGKHSDDDSLLINDSLRKANGSKSRYTGKLVKDSINEHSIIIKPNDNVTFTFNVVSPPHVEEERIYELSRLQLCGFIYFLNYNEDTKTGYYWPGYYIPYHYAIKSDWGNSVHIAFMKEIKDWKQILCGHAADDFFQIVIKKHHSGECWAWALEWNKNYRIIGFLGDEEIVKNIAYTFPSLELKKVGNDRYREEKSLAPEDDTLFLDDELCDVI